MQRRSGPGEPGPYKGKSGGRALARRPALHFFVEDWLESGAGGDLADFGVLDDAAPEFFDGGLQHGAAYIVAVNVETGKGLEETAQRLDQRVDFWKAG